MSNDHVQKIKLRVISHEGKGSKSHNRAQPHTCYNGWCQKFKLLMLVTVEKRECENAASGMLMSAIIMESGMGSLQTLKLGPPYRIKYR